MPSSSSTAAQTAWQTLQSDLASLAGGGTSASDSGQNAWLLSAYQAFSS